LNAATDIRRLALSMVIFAALAAVAMASAGRTKAPTAKVFAPAAILESSPSEQTQRLCAAVSAATGEAGAPDADSLPRTTLWTCRKAPPATPKVVVPTDHSPLFAAL